MQRLQMNFTMANLSAIMQVKIIYYSGFINKKEKSENHPKRDEDQFYFVSCAGPIAKRIKNRAPDLDIEVWSADREFDKLSCRNILVKLTIQSIKKIFRSWKGCL